MYLSLPDGLIIQAVAGYVDYLLRLVKGEATKVRTLFRHISTRWYITANLRIKVYEYIKLLCKSTFCLL